MEGWYFGLKQWRRQCRLLPISGLRFAAAVLVELLKVADQDKWSPVERMRITNIMLL
jgi:hypothetical protein